MWKKNKTIIISGVIVILLTTLAGRSVAERALGRSGDDGQRKFSGEFWSGESDNISSRNVLPEPASPIPAENKPVPEKKLAPSKNTENITVIAGQDKINLSVAPDTTFYNALIEAQGADKITFSGKKYPALGFFVTDIGTLHAGDGKDLLYYVNGKEATVGVSGYVLKNGDILEWKLE